jgi:predicted O-methyltransferase YrrM
MHDEHGWAVHDAASSESELQQLVFALIRMLKPELVVETGCYLGFMTQQMGLAVKRNGRGRVVSCDTDEARVAEALVRTRTLPVEVRHCRGIDLPELAEADFIFVDSDYQCRAEEIAAAKPGAVLLVHDTRISYDSDVAPLEGLVRSLGGITFDSHRGWGLLRKG